MDIKSATSPNENAVAAELAARATGIEAAVRREEDGVPFLVLPPGVGISAIEHLLPQPTRVRQKVRLLDARSFVAYVNAFKVDNTRLFASLDSMRVVSVFDYHEASGDFPAKWGEHRAILKLGHDPAFLRWKAKHNVKMDQVSFAEFLEDAIPDIARPSVAELYEIATNLEVKRNASFLSSVRLNNGAHQFKYQEEQTENSPKGTITVPEMFTLGLFVFEGDPQKTQIDARFRYRLDGGKLSLWFSLVRIEDVIREAFAHVLKDIAEGTAVTPLLGSAPSQAGGQDE